MRGVSDNDEDDAPAPTSAGAATSTAPAQGALTYEDGLRHAHDFLRGVSTNNPFSGRSEYGELSKSPTAVKANPQQTIGVVPESVLSNPGRPGGVSMGSGVPGRNVVRETMAGAGAPTNQSNFPAGLPRAPGDTDTIPEVGGTRAVPTLRARNQRATEPQKPAFFGAG